MRLIKVSDVFSFFKSLLSINIPSSDKCSGIINAQQGLAKHLIALCKGRCLELPFGGNMTSIMQPVAKRGWSIVIDLSCVHP